MPMTTAKELASLLDGREYGSETTKEETLLAKASGLVVVYGASDDLMEFEGGERRCQKRCLKQE